jgi:hypothetical protein
MVLIIRLNNTTLSKLNHLLYMDDIKLYASKKNHILSLLTIIENFSNNIGMSFGIDKCKMQSICRGHYEHLEYITKEGEIIKNLNKGEFYKYLGINQSNHIQHSIIKENLEKQFYLRINSILYIEGEKCMIFPKVQFVARGRSPRATKHRGKNEHSLQKYIYYFFHGRE